jgi:hypothetical protein
MSYAVLIRRNSDGEVRRCEQKTSWIPKGPEDISAPSLYWWTDGNMGCDCNRHLEFERAGGRDFAPGSPESVCGHGRYSALKAILPDGQEITLDGWDGPPEDWLKSIRPLYEEHVAKAVDLHEGHGATKLELVDTNTTEIRCPKCGLTRISCQWWGPDAGARVLVSSPPRRKA